MKVTTVLGSVCRRQYSRAAAAALEYCRRQTEPKTVVTFICDHGAKYLDKMFNDFWMMDQGFMTRTDHGDLRDLIARRHTRGEDWTIQPTHPLLQAFKLMRLYDVSQAAAWLTS